MIRQVIVGLFAGVVAVAAMLIIRPAAVAPPMWAGPLLLAEDDVEYLRTIPTTSPSTTPATPSARVPSADPLAGRRLANMRFDKAPLKEVFETLRRETGVNLVVDWGTLGGAGIKAETPVTIELHDVAASTALRAILEVALEPQHRIVYCVDDNVVVITSADNRENRYAVMRIYDVRDLMLDATRFSRVLVARGAAVRVPPDAPATPTPAAPLIPAPTPVWLPHSEEEMAEMLKAYVMDSIRPESWRDRGGMWGNIAYFGGRLMVTQTADVQDQVVEVLRKLREKG